MNQRIFVRKKDQFQVESQSLKEELKSALHLGDDFDLDYYVLYDVFNADASDLDLLKKEVLSEVVTDEVFDSLDLEGKDYLAMEYLPGQYDQRADSARQCLMLLNNKDQVDIHSGKLLILTGASQKEQEEIARYLINPVESRKKDLSVLENDQNVEVEPVPILEGFRKKSQEELDKMRIELGLAMSLEDLKFIQKYFKEEEDRDPTMTEIRVLDTYWSDHCRHTTFETVLQNIRFEPSVFQEQLQKSYEDYLALRQKVHEGKKEQTLMDMATIAGKALRREGKLEDLEVSDEINACSIEITVDVDGQDEDWLLMFKNETHNHPTEIEPFGGASTCIGGAIRDPLSGRSYVYQAMRITGAGDITKPVEETLPHKLPQSKISKTAAQGYSSYGNQIGLATTFVEEVYDPGYVAKRMEVGAVVGAAPKSNVRREKPAPGDLIVLIGGATGRDGIGGATGSSKEHTDTSLEKCSSEVQKGNALIERKLQRLFRNPTAARMMKKSNDFGAGGVSVAVGELADGLEIDLDAVDVKYEGLDGTELAISESQERMAVCIEAKDFEAFRKECEKENLGAIVVAKVTENPRLVMDFKGQRIVDLSRAFLDTNGVRSSVDVVVEDSGKENPFEKQPLTLAKTLQSENVASQIGLAEMFDASIGKSTVLMPFGGKYQLTPEIGSVQKLPVHGFTNTVSFMSYGYTPAISNYSPYLGAAYSVVEALAKLAALGANPLKARLSNQEYFERLNQDPQKWGNPFQALLGLMDAQMAFETPAIGGKDSMSGTFNDLHVPPTLITFAVTPGKADKVISSALKQTCSHLYLLAHTPKENFLPDYEGLKNNFKLLEKLNAEGKILAARDVKNGGLKAALAKMAFGNQIGVQAEYNPEFDKLGVGSIVIEASQPLDIEGLIYIGKTISEPVLHINEESMDIKEALALWEKRYGSLYPRIRNGHGSTGHAKLRDYPAEYAKVKVEKPKVVIPVFPGQNCEYDTAQKFERAGAETEFVIFNNQSVEHIEKSIQILADKIRSAQILMIVGGFSSADEPDGSGKFIASVLKNPKIARAIEEMRENNGLILGICNGFQALVKSGLLPYGDSSKLDANSPTLFRNDINRHISHVASTRVTSNLSPWLSSFTPGQIHQIPISHGEGKFVASEEVLEELEKNGQIAFQYVDSAGNLSMAGDANPNGSAWCIEGITSADGRILGKMGHSERWEEGLFQNIPADKDQDIFANGVNFFTHAK